MDKHIVKPTVGVLFAAFALIASIIALLAMNGSVAWFAKSDRVEAHGLSVSVSGGSVGFTEVSYYGITDISGTSYTFTTTAPDSLPLFDPEGISYSQYKHALLIYLVFHISDGKTCQLTATCPSDAEEVLFSTNNHLSNAVQFRVVDSIVDDVASASSTTASFVDLVSSGEDTVAQKSDSIVLADGLTSETTSLCLIMEYNEPVVRYIGGQRMVLGLAEVVKYAPYITLSLAEVSAP